MRRRMVGGCLWLDQICFFMVLLARGAVPVENKSKELHPIDKINISAFVTDFSDTDLTENVSKVVYESSDVINLSLIVNTTQNIISNPEDFIVTNYLLTFLVENLDDSREYTVEEVHSNDDEISRLSVRDPQRNASSTCTLHTNGFGLATTGVRCKSSRNLPEECFCWDGVCTHPFLPFYSLVSKLLERGEDLVESHPGFVLWCMNSDEIKINATFAIVDDRFLFPVVISIEGYGYSLGSKRDVGRLKYSTVQFQPSDPVTLRRHIQPSGPNVFDFQPSPGIFCPQTSIHSSRTLPEFPSQFSVQIETVQQGSRTVSYSQHHYDLKHKLVSMKFSPNPHSSPSVFLSTLSLAPHLLPQTYNIIHDFNTGLQYTVNDQTGNCSVQPISPADVGSVDSVTLEGRFRLKMAKELLDVSPQHFIYSGKRYIRGILADVWVAEKLGENPDDPYSTIEIYFSDSDFTLQVGEVNEMKNVPLGMKTYQAESQTSAYFQSESVYHYFQFSGMSPISNDFDISNCLLSQDRLFLKVTFQVSYGKLVQFGLPAVQDSIRAALANLAGVSPLRVIDIFISSSSQSAGVDVWFVLLQRPEVSGTNVESTILAKNEPNLPDAFQNLVEMFDIHRPQIRLQVREQKSMMVSGLGGSLDIIREAIHPASRSRSYLFFQTTYTAGSMATLGFSMAVIGLSVGIFVGFLLWKRRLGLPYHLGWHQTPIMGSPMAELTPAYPGPPHSYQNMGVRY